MDQNIGRVQIPAFTMYIFCYYVIIHYVIADSATATSDTPTSQTPILAKGFSFASQSSPTFSFGSRFWEETDKSLHSKKKEQKPKKGIMPLKSANTIGTRRQDKGVDWVSESPLVTLILLAVVLLLLLCLAALVLTGIFLVLVGCLFVEGTVSNIHYFYIVQIIN